MSILDSLEDMRRSGKPVFVMNKRNKSFGFSGFISIGHELAFMTNLTLSEKQTGKPMRERETERERERERDQLLNSHNTKLPVDSMMKTVLENLNIFTNITKQ